MKGNDMDYERGLDALRQLAEGTDWYQDFTVHEAPLLENLRDERRYGPSEQTRRDRTRIVDQLNALTLKHLGMSFTDLCLGRQPSPRSLTEVKGNGVPAHSEHLYGTGDSWAVLVGVNKYEDNANYGELEVCVKDVEAVHKQLVTGGFDPARIRLLTDHTDEPPTRANILTALKAIADATEQDDLLLFYYSGHGEEDGGESYLIARDGRRLVLSDTAVPLTRVKEIMEEAPARAKVIVLDACHSGADIGGKGPKPMSEAFIRRVFEQAEGMVILAACKQGQLSYEWRENKRSVFTHFLLEALSGAADRDEKGFVTVQDANQHVVNGVKLWASQHSTSQTPTLQYTVAGDIVLVHCKDNGG
jgi:N-acetylmuramoyl-L-alanine amidase